MQITAAMVKELRERTGSGMMECKKALQEVDGDMETAIENMRKSVWQRPTRKPDVQRQKVWLQLRYPMTRKMLQSLK